MTKKKTPADVSPLEATFRATCAEYAPIIKAKIKAAKALIREAEKLSEKSGVPFKADMSPDVYIPMKFESEFSELRDGPSGDNDDWDCETNDKLFQELCGLSAYDISEDGGSRWSRSGCSY